MFNFKLILDSPNIGITPSMLLFMMLLLLLVLCGLVLSFMVFNSCMREFTNESLVVDDSDDKGVAMFVG